MASFRQPTERNALPRVLSRLGVASRKQAEAWVKAGRVTVNGRSVRDVRATVQPADRIAVDGQPVERRAVGTWIVLNKPRGIVTTTEDERGRTTVMDLLGSGHPPGLYPVGRLDQASSGLLLFTDDHAFANRLLDPECKVEKVYRVKVDAVLDETALRVLADAHTTEDGERLGPMNVTVESRGPRSTWLRIGLREGRNRQIRRRIAHLGHGVEHLIRVSVGPLDLGDLAPGSWRPLAASEIQSLRDAIRGPGPREGGKSSIPAHRLPGPGEEGLGDRL